MEQNSAIMLLMISSNTSLRAAFIIPICSWEAIPSEISDTKLMKEQVSLLGGSCMATVSHLSVFHAFTTDSNVKGVHLLSV